ncbi:MAG: hypothetical protein ABIP94_17405, partial [Planctomycetota bacterium]
MESNPKWNHGEGFAAGSTPDADHGGWFEEDDGSNVTIADVHTPNGWLPWMWVDSLHALSPKPMRRCVGYLRPDGNDLPGEHQHPLYGYPSLVPTPTYVDQGAFELFAPSTAPASTTSLIAIVIWNWPTRPQPAGIGAGPQIYPGIFSPDGLFRAKNGPTLTDFRNNILPDTVGRPAPLDQMIGTVPANATYWPIAGYAVLSVPGRPTTLNEQRNMQLLTAIKLLLQDPGPGNPLYAFFGGPTVPGPLTPVQIEQRVVVVFAGSSNGGHQSMWSLMRYPERIHGSWSEVINPNIQRLFGEHDLGFALGRLSGLGNNGATVTEADFLLWGQYTWNQGYWIHDISFLRRFLRGQIPRPAFFRVGDEDITSTGTDWAGVANGGAWAPFGKRSSPPVLGGWPTTHDVAWTIAENSCHGNSGASQDPYANGTNYQSFDLVHPLIERAVTQRVAELATVPAPVAPHPAAEYRSSAPVHQFRGLDDPHEWALGRAGEPMPTHLPTEMLRRDDAWFAVVQPGAAGTSLGHKEAMLIRDQKLYVVGAEGVVSCFEVDLTVGNKQRLRKLNHSNPTGP